MVRKLSLILFAVIVVLGLAFVAYRYASPKVILVNESSASYDELIVNLPSSRVSLDRLYPMNPPPSIFPTRPWMAPRRLA